MDSRIRHEQIANEAARVRSITGRNDDLANWYEAIENLEIFPRNEYSLHRVWYREDDAGDFGLIHSGYVGCPFMLYRYSCRETFERDLYLLGSLHGNFPFGFMFVTASPLRVAHLIRNIELDRLNLGQLTTFMKVKDAGSLLYVRPSSFWTDCEMRFSLFTVLLRAGKHYYFNGIEEAIQSSNYGSMTFPAIRLFLNGRRNYTGPSPNWRRKWVGTYSGLSEDQIYTLSH